MSTSFIPKGYHTVTPYLIIRNAEEAIRFYKKAFGAIEVGRITMPGGKIGHAELEIGDSRFMLAEEFEEWGQKSPSTLGATPVGFCIYVKDVDEAYKKVIEAGGRSEPGMEVKDQFYGDRSGSLLDPFGHRWVLATHTEDVSFAEMQKRSDKMFEEQKS
jgi:PhnB protein